MMDIEKIDVNRFLKFKPDKILNSQEFLEYKNLDLNLMPNFLNKMWTIKEAIFKQQNGNFFKPHLISSEKSLNITKNVAVNGENYYLSLALGKKNGVNFNYYKKLIKIT